MDNHHFTVYFLSQPPEVQAILKFARPRQPVITKDWSGGLQYVCQVAQYLPGGWCNLAIIDCYTNEPTGDVIQGVPLLALKPVTYH